MSNVDIQDFVKFTSSGIEVANFTDIRTALINRYKEVYGSDIDLGTATADGVFVNDLSLMINNILQTMVTLYSNLDVDKATGIYLDTLCALSNVTRKQATYSNVSLLIKNIGAIQLNGIKTLTFLDNAGNEWIWTSKDDSGISLGVNEVREITATCTIPGAIEAPIGFIKSLVQMYTLSITQNNPANVGHEIETDDELRARRSQSSGSKGITVLESLVGSLLNVSGVEDAYVYNNDSNTSSTSKDGTSIDAHSVYVITRYEEGVTIDDATIGTIIHSKLTPGIHSCAMDSEITTGENKNYVFLEKTYNMSISESAQNIYWKRAIGINPEIKIVIKTYDYFTSSEIQIIGDYIIKYLNNLNISTNLDKNQILIQSIYADPKFKGNATYGVTQINIDDEDIANPDTYYNYTNVEGEQDEVDNTIWTITLS